ncbi:PAS domain-containing protein (plasmid) [Kozakia baliensis]|uniref:PAS domain-containing protein n=1 Tax=Kozakia baliensis TaxID=153496 RepID=UPI00345C122E
MNDESRLVAVSKDALYELVNILPQLYWRSTDDAQQFWHNDYWHRLTGFSENALTGHGWIQTLHPDDRPYADSLSRSPSTAGQVEGDCRVFDSAREEYRWFRLVWVPSSQDTTQKFGVGYDIHEWKSVSVKQEARSGELVHRLRNTFGLMRDMTRKLSENHFAAGTALGDLDGRIGCLSRIFSAAMQDPELGIDLFQIIGDEFLACGVENERIAVEGPPVRLRLKYAENIGLAVHELILQSLKSGLLSASSGNVEINWILNQDKDSQKIMIFWKEQEGNIPRDDKLADPFSEDFIVNGLKFNIDANVSLILEKGVNCVISFHNR